MGNSQSTTPPPEGVTIKSDEQVVNFQLFSDDEKKEPTDEEIESSQLDHFSPEKRVEELKAILGEEFIKKQQNYFTKAKPAMMECFINFAYAQSKQLENYGTSYIACLMRKTESFAKQSREFKCLKDEYIDEMLDIDYLLELPKEIAKEKLEKFTKDYMICAANKNSNENIRLSEMFAIPNIVSEPYSGILATPLDVQVMKSRYLPNKTLFEKKEIESQLMEPFTYDPKSDSEHDFDRKLMALSQTDFLKHDIKLVKECYQSTDQKIKRSCFLKYLDVFNLAQLVLCKRNAEEITPFKISKY